MKGDKELHNYYIQFGPNYHLLQKQTSLPHIQGVNMPVMSMKKTKGPASPQQHESQVSIIGEIRQSSFNSRDIQNVYRKAKNIQRQLGDSGN